jgi:hypothetical protein
MAKGYSLKRTGGTDKHPFYSITHMARKMSPFGIFTDGDHVTLQMVQGVVGQVGWSCMTHKEIDSMFDEIANGLENARKAAHKDLDKVAVKQHRTVLTF